MPDPVAVLAVLIAAAGLLYMGKQLDQSGGATAAQFLLQVES